MKPTLNSPIHKAWIHLGKQQYTVDAIAKVGSVSMSDGKIFMLFPPADLALDFVALNQDFNLKFDFIATTAIAAKFTDLNGVPYKDTHGLSGYTLVDSDDQGNHGAIAYIEGRPPQALALIAKESIRADNQVAIHGDRIHFSRNLLGKACKMQNVRVQYESAAFAKGGTLGDSITCYMIVESKDGRYWLRTVKHCAPMRIGQGNPAEKAIKISYDPANVSEELIEN
jgi:hypothetical protein